MLFTWIGSRGSVGGRESGVCEFWYMGGGVGETIGTWKHSRKRSLSWFVNGKSPLYFYDLLVWALLGLGQRWVVVAVFLGELREFEKDTLVSQKTFFFNNYNNEWEHQCYANLPGGHTIWGKSMFWLGFIGCAETIAGSMACPSNSNIESWQHRGNERQVYFHWHLQGARSYLHKVVGSLHLCH